MDDERVNAEEALTLQVAECEDALSNWVAVALRPTQGIGENAAAPIVERIQKRSFGQLLSELEKDSVLDPALVARLRKLLSERNWLIHHAKRNHRGVLNRPEKFDELVERIDWIAEEATKLTSGLGAGFEEYVVSRGVDRTFIDEEAERIRRAWGNDV